MSNENTAGDTRQAALNEVLPPGSPARSSAISLRQVMRILAQDVDQQTTTLSAMTPDQMKLVETVRGIQTFSDDTTKAKLASAVRNDVWLAIDNTTSGGGDYNDKAKLIRFVLHRPDPDPTKNVDYSAWSMQDKAAFRSIAAHELEHYDQNRHERAEPPPDVRPIDQLLWYRAVEAQADKAQDRAVRHEYEIFNPQAPSAAPPSHVQERFDFINSMRNDDFHEAYYRNAMHATDTQSGRELTVQELANAFGKDASGKGNFLTGAYRSIDDIQAGLLKPGQQSPATVQDIFAAASRPANFMNTAQLQAQDNGRDRRVLMMPDGQRAIVLSLDGNKVLYQSYRKEPMANGVSAFNLENRTPMPLVNDRSGATTTLDGKTDHIYMRVMDGKLKVAMTTQDAGSATENFVVGDPAAIDVPTASISPVRPPLPSASAGDGWMAQQRAKTGALTGNFSQSTGATFASPTAAAQPGAAPSPTVNQPDPKAVQRATLK